METVVKLIKKDGGDILKFLGDEIIVIWPKEEGILLNTIARKAAQCSLELLLLFDGKRILKESNKFSIKIGIGVGKCEVVYLGHNEYPIELIVTGNALIQALRSKHAATKSGKIIASRECWGLIKDNFDGIQASDNGSYEIVTTKGPELSFSSELLKVRNKILYFVFIL